MQIFDMGNGVVAILTYDEYAGEPRIDFKGLSRYVSS